MSIRWSKIVRNSNDILAASKEGFDCIEMDIGYIISLSEDEFSFHKNLMLEKDIFCEICNSILPSNVRVSEDGFNTYVWIDYLKKAAKRASQFGCKTFVWNSGQARLLPFEEDTGNAKEQIFQFLYMLCEVLKNYNIKLLIEPLGLAHTNYINNIEEANELLGIINKENFSSLISINQMSQIGFKVEDFEKYSSIIKHIYSENPVTCTNYNYDEIFKNINEAGYDQTVSLPINSTKESLEICKNF